MMSKDIWKIRTERKKIVEAYNLNPEFLEKEWEDFQENIRCHLIILMCGWKIEK